MESKDSYDKFRGELNHLLTAGDTLSKEDKDLLQIISTSNNPRGVLDFDKEIKDEGNILFKKGSIEDAFEKYGYAGLVLGCFNFEESDRNEFFDLACCSLLNSVACFSKKKQEFEQVGLICTLILDYNPKHVKALFKRAMAAVALGKSVYAYYDLLLALEIEPSNKEIQRKLEQVSKSVNVQGSGKSQDNHVPVGLGIGVDSPKKMTVKKLSDDDKNKENLVCEDVSKAVCEDISMANISVNKRSHDCQQEKRLKKDEDSKNDEMMEVCESSVTHENHNESRKHLNSDSCLDHGAENVINMNENVA